MNHFISIPFFILLFPLLLIREAGDLSAQLPTIGPDVSFHHWTGWNRMSPMNARSMEVPLNRSFKLYVMLHGDVFEAFLDDKIAIGSRVQIPKGALAISARDSRIELRDLRITQVE